MPGSKSPVWQHFDVGLAEDGCKTASCRLCDDPASLRLPQKTTSPLWAHLEKHLKEEFNLLAKKNVSCVEKKNTQIRQPTLLDLAQISSKKPYGRFHHKQIKFDENFRNLIVDNYVPFKMAESESFKQIVSDLDPKIVVKSDRTYSKQICKSEQKMKNNIKKIIRDNAKGVLAMTTDMWKDKKQNSYCSLTVHFIDNNFKLNRITPAIKYFGVARHNAVNIAATLSKEIN